MAPYANTQMAGEGEHMLRGSPGRHPPLPEGRRIPYSGQAKGLLEAQKKRGPFAGSSIFIYSDLPVAAGARIDAHYDRSTPAV
jgi:hypothetical protein